ncbi:hypothetical protein MBLNU230_g1459t1 [Neophaeotheca triangularis]
MSVAMSSDQEHAIKTSNLARIRDNQRRSRARRKEYLSELENKYRVCEQTGVEASAEIQAAARRVVAENRRLKQLLKEHGVGDAEIEALGNGEEMGAGSVSAVAGQLEGMLGVKKACGSGSGSGSGGCGPGVGAGSCGPGAGSKDGRGRSASGSANAGDEARLMGMPVESPASLHPLATANLVPNQRSSTIESPQSAVFSNGSAAARYSSSHSSSPGGVTTPQIHSTPRTQPGPIQSQSQPQPQPQLQQQQPQHPPHHEPPAMPHLSFYTYPDYNSTYNSTYQPPDHNHHYPYHNPDPTNTYNQPLPIWPETYSHPNLPQTAPNPLEPDYKPQPSPPDITETGTSSCYAAASAIRTYKADLGFELEEELGCGDGRDCHVPNSRVFSLMDRYSEAR